MPDRLTRCRYLTENGERCTAEALDPDGDVILCIRHASQAIAMVEAAKRNFFNP